MNKAPLIILAVIVLAMTVFAVSKAQDANTLGAADNYDPAIAKICLTDHLHDQNNYWLHVWIYQDFEQNDYWSNWVQWTKGGEVDLLVSFDTLITSRQVEHWSVPYHHEEMILRGLEPYERVFWIKDFNIPRVYYTSLVDVQLNIEDADVLDWNGNRVCSSERCGDVEGWDDTLGLFDPFPVVPWESSYSSSVAWCINYLTHTEFLKLPAVANLTSHNGQAPIASSFTFDEAYPGYP
jgi:hypothetical protein